MYDHVLFKENRNFAVDLLKRQNVSRTNFVAGVLEGQKIFQFNSRSFSDGTFGRTLKKKFIQMAQQ